jgi:hypothetical protein
VTNSAPPSLPSETDHHVDDLVHGDAAAAAAATNLTNKEHQRLMHDCIDELLKKPDVYGIKLDQLQKHLKHKTGLVFSSKKIKKFLKSFMDKYVLDNDIIMKKKQQPAPMKEGM